MTTTTIFDVARYILTTKTDTIDCKSLQALCYLSQLHSIVSESYKLLFCNVLYPQKTPAYKGLRDLKKQILSASDLPSGDSDALTKEQKQLVDDIYNIFGKCDKDQLIKLAKLDEPLLCLIIEAIFPPTYLSD